MQVIDKIISNFTNSKSLYIGEKVTISEHMIQTAMLAEKAKCDDNLICSSLLHDYGHFILENPDELVNLREKKFRKEKLTCPDLFPAVLLKLQHVKIHNLNVVTDNNQLNLL